MTKRSKHDRRHNWLAFLPKIIPGLDKLLARQAREGTLIYQSELIIGNLIESYHDDLDKEDQQRRSGAPTNLSVNYQEFHNQYALTIGEERLSLVREERWNGLQQKYKIQVEKIRAEYKQKLENAEFNPAEQRALKKELSKELYFLEEHHFQQLKAERFLPLPEDIAGDACNNCAANGVVCVARNTGGRNLNLLRTFLQGGKDFQAWTRNKATKEIHSCAVNKGNATPSQIAKKALELTFHGSGNAEGL